jgi:hypothetical protein
MKRFIAGLTIVIALAAAPSIAEWDWTDMGILKEILQELRNGNNLARSQYLTLQTRQVVALERQAVAMERVANSIEHACPSPAEKRPR